MESFPTIERPVAPSVTTEKNPALLRPKLITASPAILATALLAACGGGGAPAASTDTISTSSNAGVTPAATNSAGHSPTPNPNTTSPATGAAAVISAADASRFLAQASLGASRAQMARVQAIGYAAWIDEQIALAGSSSRWDWLVANGYDTLNNQVEEKGFESTVWRKMLASPDTLRQRVTLALSEIMVVSVDGLVGSGWRSFAGAAYLDLLEANAFGNYRSLLGAVSTSVPMGEYLTFRSNIKANPITGAQPDENYAREIMQLFTIGLVALNLDGTPKLVNGVPQETYTQADILGMARVFTGWDFDLAGGTIDTPDHQRRPMRQYSIRHETGTKSFLGTTIPANTDGVTSLKLALDALFAHPNIAPFVSRQLIQRLVCSNPSPAYVGRVSTVFLNDGSGVKGNLAAVVKAILLDAEAREPVANSATTFGKLREPILRLTAWARAYNVSSISDMWAVGNTSDPGKQLGQSPLRSASVFNFFRPGYVPPNTAIATAGLVAPEFQLTNESTVVGYINFMQRVVSAGIGDIKPDYSSLLPLADDAAALVAETNLALAAGQLSGASITTIVNAITSMPAGSDANRNDRIYAALTLVLAAPEFIVQK